VASVHLTGKKKARKKRQTFDVPGHAHFLTFSCYRRRAYLRTDEARDVFIECLESSRKRLGFEVVAYVVMPEHVHLLVFPKDGLKVRSVLQSVKQPVARSLGKKGEPFWQPGGGHDRNVHTRKAASAVIDYVHDNPVVRGLCATREEYRWSSARWYVDRTGPVEVDPW
jgi:putative transposase